jgi:hypothetical protein
MIFGQICMECLKAAPKKFGSVIFQIKQTFFKTVLENIYKDRRAKNFQLPRGRMLKFNKVMNS